MIRLCVTITAIALVAFASVGCSKKASIEEGKAKMDELAAKGVPERNMSDIKMFIVQMESAKKIGNSSLFKIYQDSLTRALVDFEGQMTALLEQSGPYMDSLRKTCDDKIALLKGLHSVEAEKGKFAVDSLMKIESQKLYARNRLDAWSLKLDTLIIQQKQADSLHKEFVGKWIMEMESPDPSYKVVERTEIHMKPDGSLYIMEGKKGKSSEMSEDYLFESYGTWELKGDVAHHNITREKRVRQIFEGVDPQTGKRNRDVKPPYDSTVANGTKDRYADWTALNKDYKRFPINSK